MSENSIKIIQSELWKYFKYIILIENYIIKILVFLNKVSQTLI